MERQGTRLTCGTGRVHLHLAPGNVEGGPREVDAALAKSSGVGDSDVPTSSPEEDRSVWHHFV
jgi:hypothetical protein